MLQSKILVWRRSDPQDDCDAMAINIPDKDWPTVERAVAWLSEAAGSEWGRSIPRVKVIERTGCVSTPTRVERVLMLLATGCRYRTGEGLYRYDCPEFASAGIHRS